MFLNFRDQSETFFVDFQTLWTLLTHLIFVTYKTLVIIIIPVPQIPKEMCLVRSYAYIVYTMRQLFFRFDFCSCICRHRSSRCLAWLLANFWQYIGNFCRQHRRPIARKSRPSYNCRMSSDNFLAYYSPTHILLYDQAKVTNNSPFWHSQMDESYQGETDHTTTMYTT